MNYITISDFIQFGILFINSVIAFMAILSFLSKKK